MRERENLAAVSCSPSLYMLGGVNGNMVTGKLGRAWVGAWVGAWVVHGMVHGWVMCRDWVKCGVISCPDTPPNASSPSPTRPPPMLKSNLTNPGSITTHNIFIALYIKMD